MAELWKRDEVESPCAKICLLDPETGYCLGCGRTEEEIGNWSRFSPNERREISAKLAARMGSIGKKRKGGRKARRA